MADIDVSFYPKAPQGNAFLDTAQGAVGLANASVQNKQMQQDLVIQQVNSIVNGFSSLAAKPDLSPGDFQTLGQTLVDQGVLSPEVFAAEAKNIPANASPDQLRQIATAYATRALDAGQRFSAQFGTPTMVDSGNMLTPATVSPLTGIHPIGDPIQKTLSPSELASPATIGVTGQGQPVQGTTGQFLEAAGVNPLTAQPQAQPANPLMPAAGPSPSSVPGGGVVTTLPAGAVEAQTNVGGESGNALAGDLARERTFQQDVAPLQKAIPALEKLGTTGTGPGTEQINEIVSFLQSMGLPGFDAEKIKDFDEARKYLTQYAQTAGDTGTNDKLAAAFAGNPSVGISNAAAVDVAKTALSLRRLQNAAVRSFTGTPDQYLQYVTNFNASQDPRAYGLDLMSQDARKKLIEGLKGDEKTKFVQSLRTAIDLGLVSPPQGAAGGQ